MPRTLALTGSIAVALVVMAAAASWALRHSAPSPPSTASAGSPGGGVHAPGSNPAATSRMSVDTALKELELIRPPRPRAAEDFTVALLDGTIFRLGDQRGKVVFINFWATWCPPCLEEMPAMERLYGRHKNRGFVMMAVSVDANVKAAEMFVKERGFTFSVGLDPKLQLAQSYGVRALPSTFLIDGAGTLAALALGPRAWDSGAAHALIEGTPR